MDDFKDFDRLLIQVELEPIQGERFQPTGFPDLGAAEIPSDDNLINLLVESPQSMANRMEEICLTKDKSDFLEALSGLTMIIVKDKKGKQITNSVREAHRIGSYYIIDGESDEIKKKLENLAEQGVELYKIAPALFELDINSLLHGMWIAKKIASGRIKVPRALSAFIEAKNVKSVTSGGVKLDNIESSRNEDAGGAEKGQGHIPFSRIEYTAESITAFFNLDLQQIKSYNLKDCQTELLITLALWKIQIFLQSGLRLRTACDLKVKEIKLSNGFTLPTVQNLTSKIGKLISDCKDYLPDPITIIYNIKAKSKKD